jgi:nanoRNase/pAp phosphatase (c-di-AMP/oligoRNAs hydrolase)
MNTDIFGSIDGLVGIYMHSTPDPDALGSAFAIQWILKKKYSIESNIIYEGEISHPQNKTMINCLNINLIKINDVNLDDYTHHIIVDATENNAAPTEATFVIDHHKSKSDFPNTIEPVGAASTIVYEICKNLEMKFEDELDCNVAAALYIGIKIDTNDLLNDNAVDRDHNAFLDLLSFVDKKKLQGIIDYPLPAYFYELECELHKEGNNMIEGSCWVGNVGIIAKAKRDALPILAEKMLKREGIETSVVFGVVGNNVDASVRSTNASLNVDQFCKQVFSKEHSGGKMGAGGSQSPLGICSLEILPNEIKEKMWGGIKDGLFYKILHFASGN